MVVWTLILQSDSEGPTLISCAAKLLKGDSTFSNLLLAPSWRTTPKDLGRGHVVSSDFQSPDLMSNDRDATSPKIWQAEFFAEWRANTGLPIREIAES